MDRASYRGAMVHQKIIISFSESFPVVFALFRDFQLKCDQPTPKNLPKAAMKLGAVDIASTEGCGYGSH